VLPGGAAGVGVLLSVAGLSGLVGAPLGGILTDRAGARFAAVSSGIISGLGLVLVPFSLGTSVVELSSLDISLQMFEQSINGRAAAFAVAVIIWSLGATAQGPALTALAQKMSPKGAEATSLALPRAAGDGAYIVAPFLLGAVADSALNSIGSECALAGLATLIGATALAVTKMSED
jgi:MFS family permease